MQVAAIMFLFLVRSQLPKSKSITDILCRKYDKSRKYGKSTLKRIRKFEKFVYRLSKAEMYLKFLLRCRRNNVISSYLNFGVSSQWLKRISN